MFLESLPFKVMSIVGGWNPNFNSFPKKKYDLYSGFSLLVITIFYSFTILETIRLTQALDNFNEFNEIFFLFLTSIMICVKIAFYVIFQNNIVKLGSKLLSSACVPCNGTELLLEKKFVNINK